MLSASRGVGLLATKWFLFLIYKTRYSAVRAYSFCRRLRARYSALTLSSTWGQEYSVVDLAVGSFIWVGKFEIEILNFYKGYLLA